VQFQADDELVKNPDDNWPTASRIFSEVTGVGPFGIGMIPA
jgi:hypothetical protein